MLTVSIAIEITEPPNRQQEELWALEAKYNSLQLLVAELLIKNQNLRAELGQIKDTTVIAPATHPQQSQDR